jgi:hypothetical protein
MGRPLGDDKWTDLLGAGEPAKGQTSWERQMDRPLAGRGSDKWTDLLGMGFGTHKKTDLLSAVERAQGFAIVV